MSGRITTPFERALTTTVNDIEHIAANSYNGFGIIKILSQPNVDIAPPTPRLPHLADPAEADAARRNAALDPELLRLHVPSSRSHFRGEGGFTEQNPRRYRHQPVAHAAGDVPGAAIPYPFGGKQRQVQIDLDPNALQARGLSGQDVANALAAQNLIRRSAPEDRASSNTTSSSTLALKMQDLGDLRSRSSMGPPSMSRRRQRARRQPAADQHRSTSTATLGVDDGAEGRRDLDARYHRRISRR